MKELLDPGHKLAAMKILIVEDDSDSRQMLEMVLKSRGAEVSAVGSVREAMAVLNKKEWQPALLLSDLGMPEEDGYDLIRKIRSRSVEEGGELPAIALSGYAGREEGERALNAGYQVHLSKPVDLGELMKAIVTFSPRPSH
jgi:CheY-like chemotaxis protein